jgi:hypothetical protein
LLDGGGTLIAASADQQSYIGKRFATDALAREMLANDDGTVTVPGFDGVSAHFRLCPGAVDASAARRRP